MILVRLKIIFLKLVLGNLFMSFGDCKVVAIEVVSLDSNRKPMPGTERKIFQIVRPDGIVLEEFSSEKVANSICEKLNNSLNQSMWPMFLAVLDKMKGVTSKASRKNKL